MARATVTVGGTFHGSRSTGTRIEIESSRGRLGFWTEQGGLSEQRVHNVLERHATAAARESAMLTRRVAREEAPKRSRGYSLSIDAHQESRGERIVWDVRSSLDDLSRWINEGTGIYGPRRRPITPVSAAYLKFPRRNSGAFNRFDQPRKGRESFRLGSRTVDRAPYVYAKAVRGQSPNRVFDRTQRIVEPEVAAIHRRAARAAALEISLL